MSSPRTMWPRNWVMTRELPSLGVWMLSSPAPIQLNGRNENPGPGLTIQHFHFIGLLNPALIDPARFIRE
jgi:hypothetical protein